MKTLLKFAAPLTVALLPLAASPAMAGASYPSGGPPTALSAAQVTEITARLTKLGASSATAATVIGQINTILADAAKLRTDTKGSAAFTADAAKLKADARAAQTSVLGILGATSAQITTYFSAIDAEVAAFAALKAADAATRSAIAALPKGALRALDHLGWDFD